MNPPKYQQRDPSLVAESIKEQSAFNVSPLYNETNVENITDADAANLTTVSISSMIATTTDVLVLLMRSLVIVCSIFIRPSPISSNQEVPDYEDDFDNSTSNYTFVLNKHFTEDERGVFFTLIGFNIGGSICAYYCVTLACKLHMQQFSFAFPISLSTPVSVVFAVLFSRR